MWGAILGVLVLAFPFFFGKYPNLSHKIGDKIGTLLLLFVNGIFAGLIVSLSSVPFTKRKIIYSLVGGIGAGFFILLISKIPSLERGDNWAFLLLPTLGLFFSIAIGLADKSVFKAITGIIGSFIASVISTVLAFIVLIKVGFWGPPNPAEPVYVYFLISISSILILFGIEIGDFFKRGYLIRDEKK